MGKLTSERLKELVEERGYEYLDEEYRIKNNRKRRYIKIKCGNGHESYWVRLDAFKSGRECPYCKHDEKRFSYEYIKEYLLSFGYELISNEYKNNREKLKIKCPNRHVFYMDFTHFKDRNQRCPKCPKPPGYGGVSHDYECVKQYFCEYKYELLSNEYKNIFKPLEVKCPNGHIWKTTFHRFKNQGCRCPFCRVSKGERRIIDWLDKNKINYIYNDEYFKDLKGVKGGILKPDFIIENKKIWIEYDGEFHYEKYYEEQNFEGMKIHDELKNIYAKENGWKLIRIPYWEFDNIEKILEDMIND